MAVKNESKLLIGWYCTQLTVRVLVFLACVAAWFLAPDQLDVSRFPGLDFSSPAAFVGSVRLYHVVAVLLIIDMATKVLPRSGISLGARKQFRRYHVPTARTFEGGAAELARFVTGLVKDGTLTNADARRLAMQEAVERARASLQGTVTALQEVRADAVLGMRAIVRDRLALQGMDYQDQDLHASSAMRNKLRREHYRQSFPVLVIWVLFNALVGALLWGNGLLTPSMCLLWCAFYFLADMICVVIWCPFQVLFMKNRCCVTCHIFNWDAIMAVTPLLFAPCLLSGIMVVPALFIFILWEVSFALHPERFDERTNASLLCAGCDEKLCKWRGKCSGGKMVPADADLAPAAEPAATAATTAGPAATTTAEPATTAATPRD
ncbi:MAG: hypothetical protein Q4D06_04945 [Coriobacteriia bacterium]|nr:hypothetical protein [Coriobacteriia bacterium]